MPAELQFRNKLALAGGGTGVQNKIVGVGGRKGSGKSTLTKAILMRCDRLFLFDTMGEHTWVPDQFTNLDEAWAYIAQHGAEPGAFIGSYICEGANDDSIETDFAEICKAVYESGNMTYAVEELPMMSQPNYAPAAYKRILRLGRHHCINGLYTGQRLGECPRAATAATDLFVLFFTSEPSDLDRIAERCGPDTARLVAQLGEHEFLVYDVPTREIVVVDSGWYDSVLNTETHSEWTPAVGGRHGRKTLWSLDDDA